MKFRVQLVNRLTPDGGSWTYKILGAIVASGRDVVAIGLTDSDGDDWASSIQPDIDRWQDGPLSLMTRLHDQNGTTTAYAKPVDVGAKTPQEAAELAQIRAG